jgi:cytochrome P450/NADPH-cytochrome P450 reductase
MPFHVYLELLSPLRPRYYSISSSPLQDDRACSITVAVVSGEAKSGQGEYHGACSTYLSSRQVGDTIFAFVRDTHSSFRLPKDTRTPLIMVGPGTGLAPFRGFLQERTVQKNAGQPVGPALLFFGCRNSQQDFIYESELRDFERQGIAQLSVACSREQEQKVYVQDLLREQRNEVWQHLQAGAVIYVCGDASQMAPAVRRTFASIYQEYMDATAEPAEQWLNELTRQNRYLVDVWGN